MGPTNVSMNKHQMVFYPQDFPTGKGRQDAYHIHMIHRIHMPMSHWQTNYHISAHQIQAPKINRVITFMPKPWIITFYSKSICESSDITRANILYRSSHLVVGTRFFSVQSLL